MKKAKVVTKKAKIAPELKLENLPEWLEYDYKSPYPNWTTKDSKKNPVVPEILFSDVCELFDKLENTSKKNEKISCFTKFFLTVLHKCKSSLADLTSLISCELFPVYSNTILNIGAAFLQKVVAEMSDKDMSYVKTTKKTTGDLGLTAAKCIKSTPSKTNPILLSSVVEMIRKMPTVTGNKSQTEKLTMISFLLRNGTTLEIKYLVRILLGKLRLGLAERTILTALAIAITIYFLREKNPSLTNVDHEELKEKIRKNVKKTRRSVNETSYIPTVVEEILSKPNNYDGLEEHYIKPLVPFQAMLAEPSKSIDAITSKFNNDRFIAEEKFDGERAQIHYDGRLEIFSRNCETKTEKWLEVTALFNELCSSNSTNTSSTATKATLKNKEKGKGDESDSIDIEEEAIEVESTTKKTTTVEGNEDGTIGSFILDCEIVAINDERTKILSFQSLSKRRKKPDNISELRVQVCVKAFDILYLDGKSLCDLSILERKKILEGLIEKIGVKYTAIYNKPMTGVIEYVGHDLIEDLTLENNREKLQLCLETTIENCNEGLMLKMVDDKNGHYKPGKRAKEWRKFKKDYIKGLGDSFDLIPMGAYYGKGKRTGIYGGYLMGTLNQDNCDVETVCKVGTGFTHENLKDLFAKFKQHEVDNQPSNYQIKNLLKPDVYFGEHDIVWEIDAADLSISPVHLCANQKMGGELGIGLRFPRFNRVRKDKKRKDATTSDSVHGCYTKQANKFKK